MGGKMEFEESLKDVHVTKIECQPNDEALMKLESKLLAMTVSIPTANGTGMHGHVGMLLEVAQYITFLHSRARFVIPTNPGLYPTIVDQNDAVVRVYQIVEHQKEMVQFETYQGVV